VYRKPIFDLLNHEESFLLLHGKGLENKIIQSNAPYAKVVKQFRYWKGETNILLFVFPELIRLRPKVVIHEFAIGLLTLPMILLFSKIFKFKLILYSHGYNRKTGFHPHNKFIDRYRLFLINKSDALIVYGESDKSFMSKFIDSSKIFVAQNTLDTTKYSLIHEKLKIEGKDNVRIRLNWKEGCHLTFIGRLLTDKNPEILLELIPLISKKINKEVYIHYVGTGTQEKLLIEQVRSLNLNKNVFFHGEIHDDLLTGEILFCSDFMIMPGYLGLSVNHAFAFGCPVISFEQGENGPFHSPEVEYVLNGETGFLVKEHSPEAIAEVFLEYFNDLDLQRKIKSNLEYYVKSVFPVSKMVGGILDAVNYVKQ
jgi:glycosyltransferase involved in cell wall biosynthesis